MKADSSRPSAAARAQAAAWIARLHGSNRTPEAEAGFRRWVSEDPEHAAAFELLTDVWEKSARLQRRPLERVASWEFPGFRLSFSRAAIAATVIACVAAFGTFFYLHTDALTTAVGEQRTLTLEDGTRVYMNTATEVVARYEKTVRRVVLRKGEALFEVAKQPGWPFVVTAGDKQVRALGTAFVVRRDEDKLVVTLVEGKVTVSAARPGKPQPQGGSSNTDGSGGTTLSPGERLTFVSTRAPKLDTPPIERITAWQRGQVALDEMPLADAVAEMNRYSTTQLVLQDPQSAAIRISGIFRAGDQEDFAIAVAKTYKLEIHSTSRQIVLTSARNATEGAAQP